MISANVPNEIRKMIYRRDGFACALCGDPRFLQIHHAIFRSDGGGNTPRNLIALCRYCHAMAHGTNLLESEVWLSRDEVEQYSEEVQQNCIEYLADMYAGAFPATPGAFDPREIVDYSDKNELFLALDEIRICITSKTGQYPW